jgi:hypothetical protein
MLPYWIFPCTSRSGILVQPTHALPRRRDEAVTYSHRQTLTGETHSLNQHFFLTKKVVWQMLRPETKTMIRTLAASKTKIIKQEPQQQTTPKDKERTEDYEWINHTFDLTLCEF